MLATNIQKAKIHIARQELGLSEENYRAVLSGFKDRNGFEIKSSKHLTIDQAEQLLKLFVTKLGWKPKPPARKDKPFIKINEIPNRREEFATYDQLKKIAAMWVEKAKSKNKASLQKFIKNIAGVDLIESLRKTDVQKVVKGINSLNKKSAPHEV